MSSWNDFNDASRSPNLIPRGTLAKVRLTIRPGGYDDSQQGWTGGFATRGVSGAVYLSCEFTVLNGPYAHRKVFSLIGLYTAKGPDWAAQGRSLVRGILSSARGVSDRDMSAHAQAARRISGFADLNGLVFAARIDLGTDASGMETNEIRVAVTPQHRQYVAIMGQPPRNRGADRAVRSRRVARLLDAALGAVMPLFSGKTLPVERGAGALGRHQRGPQVMRVDAGCSADRAAEAARRACQWGPQPWSI